MLRKMNGGLRFAVCGLRLTLSAVSAILLIFTYPKFNLGFLAWIALVPVFFALEGKGIKQRFIIGYLFGIVFFSGILYWLVNVTVPGTVVLVLLLSLAPAIFCILCPITTNRPSSKLSRPGRTLPCVETVRDGKAVVLRPSSVIYVPSAWVLTEYLRTHLFTGFPWALLGYSQSFNLPVIQIADITGVYGVSFLVVLVNFGVYLALKGAPKRFHPVREIFSNGVYVLFFILALFVLVLTYGQNRIGRIYPSQKLRVSVIQGNIPQELKWDPRYREFIMRKYKAFTKESFEENPRLVVWPETSVPGYLEEESDLKSRIANLAKSGNAYLLVGTLKKRERSVFNSATFISSKGEISQSYDKIHLVPLGEFIPLERLFSCLRTIIDKPIGDFGRGADFTVFEFRVRNVVVEDERIQATTEFHRFSTLICFEDIFPDLCRNFVKRGAKFLINITNDAWFGKSAAPYQHVQGSIFRAVENRVPVVRAANTGISCIINHRGRVITSVRSGNDEMFVDGYVAGTIRPISAKTIYTRFGDVFSWGCIILVFIGLAFNFKSKV